MSRRSISFPLVLAAVLLLLSACGAEPVAASGGNVSFAGKKEGTPYSAEKNEETESEVIPTASQGDMDDLYVVRDLDMTGETVTLISVKSGKMVRYGYNILTEFKNTYGDYTSATRFTPGSVCEIGDADGNGVLRSLSLSDKIWQEEGVKKFDVDLSMAKFSFGGQNYHIGDAAYVFDGDKVLVMQGLSEGDVITVNGFDRTVISVVVTNSQGTLKLINTDKFDGSFVMIGRKIFAKITPDMSMKIPEGEYLLTVANDGYGGSCDIVIEPGQMLTVDLSELEGEGPKTCEITFEVDVDKCQIFLDGVLIENHSTETVRYGNHRLIIKADGYETWSRTLVVNSATAEISLAMTSEKSTADTETDEKKSDTENQNQDGTTTGTDNTDNNLTQNLTDQAALEAALRAANPADAEDPEFDVDYYTTLSTILNSMLD